MELADLSLSPRRAVLLVVDIQERLLAAMPELVRDELVRNTLTLLEAARRFALPVVVSEQYPRGLGPTTPRIAEAVPADAHRFEKLEFSACANQAFAGLAPGLAAAGRDQWIVVGMETHVCVWQSVRGLVGRDAAVHVVSDAVSSRTRENWQIGLDLARRAGAAVTSTETVVFDLLGKAGSDDFKALSKLIK